MVKTDRMQRVTTRQNRDARKPQRLHAIVGENIYMKAIEKIEKQERQKKMTGLHAQLARLVQPLTRLCFLNFAHVIPDITVRRGTLLLLLVRSAPQQDFLHTRRAIALGTTPVVRGAFHALRQPVLQDQNAIILLHVVVHSTTTAKMEMPHVCPVQPARRADLRFLRRFVYILVTIIALWAMFLAQLVPPGRCRLAELPHVTAPESSTVLICPGLCRVCNALQDPQQWRFWVKLLINVLQSLLVPRETLRVSHVRMAQQLVAWTANRRTGVQQDSMVKTGIRHLSRVPSARVQAAQLVDAFVRAVTPVLQVIVRVLTTPVHQIRTASMATSRVRPALVARLRLLFKNPQVVPAYQDILAETVSLLVVHVHLVLSVFR